MIASSGRHSLVPRRFRDRFYGSPSGQHRETVAAGSCLLASPGSRCRCHFRMRTASGLSPFDHRLHSLWLLPRLTMPGDRGNPHACVEARRHLWPWPERSRLRGKVFEACAVSGMMIALERVGMVSWCHGEGGGLEPASRGYGSTYREGLSAPCSSRHLSRIRTTISFTVHGSLAEVVSGEGCFAAGQDVCPCILARCTLFFRAVHRRRLSSVPSTKPGIIFSIVSGACHVVI